MSTSRRSSLEDGPGASRAAPASERSVASMPPHVRLRKLLGRIRRRFALDVFDVFARTVPPEAVHPSLPGYRFAWGSAAELAGCTLHHTELDAEDLRQGARRLELGHRVVFAWYGGDVVFSMWVNPRNLNVPGLVKRPLGPHQWFIYKAYTSPDHRGQGLYKAGMSFVLAEMAQRGLTELVGYAHRKKAVSRKGLARLTFGACGRMISVDWPFWKHVFHSKELEEHFPRARGGSA